MAKRLILPILDLSSFSQLPGINFKKAAFLLSRDTIVEKDTIAETQTLFEKSLNIVLEVDKTLVHKDNLALVRIMLFNDAVLALVFFCFKLVSLDYLMLKLFLNKKIYL